MEAGESREQGCWQGDLLLHPRFTGSKSGHGGNSEAQCPIIGLIMAPCLRCCQHLFLPSSYFFGTVVASRRSDRKSSTEGGESGPVVLMLNSFTSGRGLTVTPASWRAARNSESRGARISVLRS